MDPGAEVRMVHTPKYFGVQHAKCITRLLEKCSKINKMHQFSKCLPAAGISLFDIDCCVKFVKLCTSLRVALLQYFPAEFML